MAEGKQLWSNFIAAADHSMKRGLVDGGLHDLTVLPNSHVLSLADWFQSAPQRYYDHTAFRRLTAILNDLSSRRSSALQGYLSDRAAELDRAFFFLSEINRRDWHEGLETDGDFHELRTIDQELHPCYLRLVEAVFFPFVHLAAYFSRLDRGKSTEGLDVYNAVAELSANFPEVGNHYNNTIRNGIAHGGISFGLREIEYRDKKKSVVLSISEFVRRFDDLLDFANGLSLALGAFLLTQDPVVHPIPQQLLLSELQAETESPWWVVDGCVPTTIAAGRQLIVYARVLTRDCAKARFYGFLTAALAEELAPGYDRYFLSLRSPYAMAGFAAFDGSRLRAIRKAETSSYSDYAGVLEDDLFFFVPKPSLPHFLGRLHSLWTSLKVHWPLARLEWQRVLALPEIRVRTAKVHRNGPWAILNAAVVMVKPAGTVAASDVLRCRRRVIRRSLRVARRFHPWWKPIRWLPLGWGRVSVFQRDYRQRRLKSFGLGSDLIGTIQTSLSSRVKAPNIYESTIELRGRIRIAWNRHWLDDEHR